MLRFEQRKVLKALNQIRKERASFSEVDLCNRAKVFERDKLAALCLSLQEQGYLHSVKFGCGKAIQNLELSYLGMNYRREFVADVWKAVLRWFASNLVGLAALTVSIIALLRSL